MIAASLRSSSAKSVLESCIRLALWLWLDSFLALFWYFKYRHRDLSTSLSLSLTGVIPLFRGQLLRPSSRLVYSMWFLQDTVKETASARNLAVISTVRCCTSALVVSSLASVLHFDLFRFSPSFVYTHTLYASLDKP